jgi:hypothetical protein
MTRHQEKNCWNGSKPAKAEIHRRFPPFGSLWATLPPFLNKRSLLMDSSFSV